jgi:hypothetical protein
MATTLSRASFSGLTQAPINLKLVAIGTYVVGNTIAIGPVGNSPVAISAVITKLLPFNQIRARVTGGAPSSQVLIPKGTAVV